MMIVTKMQIKITLQSLNHERSPSKIKWELKAANSPGSSYNIAESDACVDRSARLSSAQLVIFVVNSGMSRGGRGIVGYRSSSPIPSKA